MGYTRKSGGSITPATSTTLGGVKVGSGLSVALDGTLSAAGGTGGTSSTSPVATDAYIIAGRVIGMGLADDNIRKGMTLIIGPGSVIEVALINGAVKRFSLTAGEINIANGSVLRMDLTTGALTVTSPTTAAINQVTLIRVASDDTGTLINGGKPVSTTDESPLVVVGGYLSKHFYPFGKEADLIQAPKNVSVITLDNTAILPGFVGYESMDFINGKLWVFDKDSQSQCIVIHDMTTNTVVKKVLQRGFSFNTVDYNPLNDTLLTIDNATYSKIQLIPNVSAWANVASGAVACDASTTDMDIIDFTGMGEGPQSFWGEDNGGKNNIIYTVSDAGVRVRKLLLGQGSNNLGSGTFVAGKATTRYNGTYKILDEWAQIYGGGRTQDGFFYKGSIYIGKDADDSDSFFQTGVFTHKLELLSDGRVRKTKIVHNLYDDSGAIIKVNYSAGCAKSTDGKLWKMMSGGVIYVFDIL
jgi:hypothetical protein